MNKQTLGFLLAGLAIAGVALFLTLSVNEKSHLRLEGRILKVRVLPLSGSGASIVFVDFRALNPSDVPLVVGNAKIRLEPKSDAKQPTEPVDGQSISKADVETLFQYQKLLGLKYNDVLSLQDRLLPHRSVDRMIGARFEMTEAAIDARKSLRVVIEDVDGAVVEIGETPESKTGAGQAKSNP